MLREKEKKQRVAEKNGHALPEKAHYGLNGYRPSDKEPFMNERQRDYFRAKLQMWKDEPWTVVRWVRMRWAVGFPKSRYTRCSEPRSELLSSGPMILATRPNAS